MEFDTINLILAFAIALMSSLAIVTLVFRFKNKSARAVFVQGALFSLWTIFLIWIRSGVKTDLYLSQAMFIAISLAVFSFTVFSYYFPLIKKKNLNDRLAMIFSSLLLIITVSLLFFPDLIIKNNNSVTFFTPGEFYNFYIFSILVFFLLGFYQLISKYLLASNIYKTKLTYLLISNFILFVAILYFNLISPFLGNFSYYFLGPLTAFLVMSVNVYAVLTKRFIDLRVVGKKIFIFIGAGIFSYLVYYLVSWFFISVFGSIFAWEARLSGIFIAIIFAYLFYANDYLLIKMANKYLFVDLYHYQESVNELVKKLTYHIHLKEIINITVEASEQVIKTDEVFIYLKDLKDNYFHDKKIKSLFFIKAHSEIMKYLAKKPEPLIREELELEDEHSSKRKYKSLILELKERNIHLALPLKIKNDLIGFIALGKKSLFFTYNNNDLKLLSTLSGQSAIAIERSLLYHKLEDQSKELKSFNSILKRRVKEQTKDIKQKNEDLKKLLDLKKDFLRVVNHQLNTPISIMKNSFSMIEDGSFSYKEGFKYAKAGLMRVDNTINDFWQAFAWEGETVPLNLETVNIENIIKEIINTKKQDKKVRASDLKLAIKKSNFKVPLVLADRKNIEHVISNIVDNAVNYTDKGQVSISFQKENKRLKVSISDTGIGMSSADKAHIFEKFSRGTRAVSVNPNGSGLGLYIANEIMKAHGSGIKVEKTEINKGTVFSFHLKISNETKESDYKLSFKDESKLGDYKSKKRVSNKKTNILMIEDEESLLQIYKKFFIDNNCKFTASTRAKTALQKIKKNTFDVVILDIMLKKHEGKGKIKLNSEEGWDVLSAIRKDKTLKDLPVIIFSNLNSQKDKNKASELGADNFLFKENTTPRKLLTMINKILDKKRR
jgi:signal transduction histidine kinase/CheY-like chemotaxis protein